MALHSWRKPKNLTQNPALDLELYHRFYLKYLLHCVLISKWQLCQTSNFVFNCWVPEENRFSFGIVQDCFHNTFCVFRKYAKVNKNFDLNSHWFSTNFLCFFVVYLKHTYYSFVVDISFIILRLEAISKADIQIVVEPLSPKLLAICFYWPKL